MHFPVQQLPFKQLWCATAEELCLGTVTQFFNMFCKSQMLVTFVVK